MFVTPFRSVAVMFALLFSSFQAHALAPDATSLGPSTKAFVEVPNLGALLDAWQRTPYSKALDDPSLKPFWDDFRTRQTKGASSLPWLVGLTPGEVREMTSGSLTLALTGEKGRRTFVLLAGIKGREKRSEAILTNMGKRLMASGGRLDKKVVGGTMATVIELPPSAAGGRPRQFVYVQKGDTLLGTTSLATAQTLMDQSVRGENGLAATAVYRDTVAKARAETPGTLFTCFIDPLGFAEAVRELLDEKVKAKPDPLQVLAKERFAVKGVGVSGLVAGKEHELLLRFHVHAPRPFQRSMRIADLDDLEEAPPPAWVPSGASVFGSVALRFRPAFDACATLFDEIYGDGETGVFDDIVKGLRDDPDGPGVDIHKNVVDLLKPPLMFLSLPGAKGEGWLLAADAKDDARLAGALERLFKGDRSAKRLPFGDHGLWKILPEERQNGKKNKEKEFALPASAFAVNKRALLFASSPEMLHEAFSSKDVLVRDPGYQRVHQALTQLLGKKACLRFFFRVQNNVGVVYEELRQGMPGRLADSRTKLLRSIFMLGASKDGPFDFAKLPGFDALQKHFPGVGGGLAITRTNGWSGALIVLRPAARP